MLFASYSFSLALFSDGAVLLRKRGTTFALVRGKLIAVKMSIDQELEPVLAPEYATLKEESEKYAKIEPGNQKQFMIDHDYSASLDLEEVSEDEVQVFRDEVLPLYQKIGEGWSYDDFQDSVIADAGGFTGILKESFGLMDILFFGLGIFTAFKMGTGSDEEEIQEESQG